MVKKLETNKKEYSSTYIGECRSDFIIDGTFHNKDFIMYDEKSLAIIKSKYKAGQVFVSKFNKDKYYEIIAYNPNTGFFILEETNNGSILHGSEKYIDEVFEEIGLVELKTTPTINNGIELGGTETNINLNGPGVDFDSTMLEIELNNDSSEIDGGLVKSTLYDVDVEELNVEDLYCDNVMHIDCNSHHQTKTLVDSIEFKYNLGQHFECKESGAIYKITSQIKKLQSGGFFNLFYQIDHIRGVDSFELLEIEIDLKFKLFNDSK